MDDLATILDRTQSHLERFVAFPTEHCSVACALWAAHAHTVSSFDNSPRLAFLSPEPGSGKSRALEVMGALVPNPVQAINVSPSYLFRKIADENKPTILYDEIDTVFGPKAKENEDLRGLINAGYRKGAIAGRCETQGRTVVTVDYDAFGPVAMAGLGNLPDTILTRSVCIRMKKRRKGDVIEPYRPRINEPEGHEIRDDLSVRMAVIEFDSFAELPQGIEDRDADIWEPLLTIAEKAGPDWYSKACVAAVALVADSRGRGASVSLGIRLLMDIRTVWPAGQTQQPTSELLDRLVMMDESPWGSIKGEPLNARMLANLLSQYEIGSQSIRAGGAVVKGYKLSDMRDAWERYLTEVSPPPETAATSATSATPEPPPTAKPSLQVVRKYVCDDCEDKGCSMCGQWKEAGQ